ncbi:hypothetical protein GCM10010302_06100 [Streptomyces polychromogenes]|uniref:Glucose-methanol-choline oxidoreductase C-terminal domain-containing protein n=1 Tax=Streptomyces polychromogenes TaxID=67342 RepID=A0ABP3EQU3_9ACTN
MHSNLHSARTGEHRGPPDLQLIVGGPFDDRPPRPAWRVARVEPLGPVSAGVVGAPDDDGDEAIERFVRTHVWTYHHPVGTCAMGPDPAAGAVVDPAGRVHGVDNLWVVDASIMPDVPSTNTHLPTLMLAEHIAATLRGAPPATAGTATVRGIDRGTQRTSGSTGEPL